MHLILITKATTFLTDDKVRNQGEYGSQVTTLTTTPSNKAKEARNPPHFIKEKRHFS